MKRNHYLSMLVLMIMLSACSDAQINQITEDLTSITKTIIAPTVATTSNQTQMDEKYGRQRYQNDMYIAYQDEEDFGNITITNLDGTDPIKITKSIEGYKSFISLSPDGQWLIFDVTKTDQRTMTGKAETTTAADVYIVSINHPNPQLLAHSTINNGTDPTLWDENGNMFILNCPLSERICHRALPNNNKRN